MSGSEQEIQARRLLREAQQELETAVEHGETEHATYWLGRKKGIEAALEVCDVDTDSELK